MPSLFQQSTAALVTNERACTHTTAVIEDMKWFLLFLLLTMVGFGMAFYALYRQDRTDFPVRANAMP